MAYPSCHVLLVEDSESDAERIRRMLADASLCEFEISLAVRLDQALALLETASHRTDVVLLDLGLPDSFGLDTLTALRRAWPTIPVVVLTGADDSEASLQGVREGAQDWLTKDHLNPSLLERSLQYAVERNRMELQLRSSEAKFRQLAENINEVFWVVDVGTGRLTYVSPAYEEIWGRPCDAVLANPDRWLTDIHPDERELVEALRAEAAAGARFNVQYRIMRPDGTARWIQDRGVPVTDSDRRIHRIVGIAEDITQRVDLERKIAQLTVDTQRRIGQELHDSLGQQLTGIGLFAKSLQDKLTAAGSPQAAAAAELTENIRIALSQSRKMAKGLMPVEVDTRGLMSALGQLAISTERLCNVVCKFHCEQPVAVENASQATHLFHIAQEAINNAVRHGQPKHIHVSLSGENGDVLLEVRDDGGGMGGNGDRGEGMGLDIMRHRATVIGAKLTVGAAEGGGTVIRCKVSQEVEHEE